MFYRDYKKEEKQCCMDLRKELLAFSHNPIKMPEKKERWGSLKEQLKG